MCLTEKQMDYAYKTVEEGNIINTKMMMYETKQNQDDNPYKNVIESMHVALYEVSPCKINGILLAKFYGIF